MSKAVITKINNCVSTFHSTDPFTLESGQTLPTWDLTFQTYGQRRGNNVIVIHHALSTNCHVASHAENPEPGWWEKMVGPGKPIDTNQYFVICIDNLGGCAGSTGPTHTNPATGRAYQAEFPSITINDIARSQQRLLTQLGIDNIYAIIGNSMGAMISLAWVIENQVTADNVVLTSSAYRAYPTNTINRLLQREVIALDPHWQQGSYTTPPEQGFRIARKLAHLSYRNPEELNQRFKADAFDELNNYLNYNADKFIQRFDANSYLSLLHAMDVFNVAEGYDSATDAMRCIRARVLVIGVTSDQLYPLFQQQEMFAAMQAANCDCRFIEHHSNVGHDAFLVDIDAFTRYLSDFLA